jgi:uncharacterized protein involved in exopolysaccharide biosynthesis
MKLRVSFLVLFVCQTLSICHGSNVYSATAEIEVLPRGGARLEPGTNIPIPPTEKEWQHEFEVVESPYLLRQVISGLNLDEIWAKRLNRSSTLSMDDALKFFRSRLKLDGKPGTWIFCITVKEETPREAAEIANAIADYYKAMRDHAEEQLSVRGIEVLEDQVSQQELIAKVTQAKAEQNPQDQNIKRQSEIAQSMLDALRIKLHQDMIDVHEHESPVRIVSRATPPPE